eukprot:710569-Pleurochrysis_carterae.AAC.3
MELQYNFGICSRFEQSELAIYPLCMKHNNLEIIDAQVPATARAAGPDFGHMEIARAWSDWLQLAQGRVVNISHRLARVSCCHRCSCASASVQNDFKWHGMLIPHMLVNCTSIHLRIWQ